MTISTQHLTAHPSPTLAPPPRSAGREANMSTTGHGLDAHPAKDIA
ncbi:hypothetical protein [Pseudomonas phoenicis]